MNARPALSTTTMTDPFVANQFKKVHARLEEMFTTQRRIETTLNEMASKAPHFSVAPGFYSSETTHGALSSVGTATAASSGMMLTATRSNQSSYPSLQLAHPAAASVPVNARNVSAISGQSQMTAGVSEPTAPSSMLSLLPTVGGSDHSLVDSLADHRLTPWPESVWMGDGMFSPKRSRSKRQMRAVLTTTPSSYAAREEQDGTGTQSGDMENRMPKLELARFKPVLRCAIPIHPHSKVRLFIDVASMIILLYDSIQLPLALSYPMDSSGPVLAISLASAMFWTLEIGMNMISAIYIEDTLVKDLRTVVQHYLKYWFALDFAIVMCDWVSVALSLTYRAAQESNSTSIVKSARLLKLGRIIRILAVLRMGRFAQVYNYIVVLAMRQGRAAYIEFGLSISKLVLLILWFNHVGSCLWHGLAFENPFFTDTGRSWQQDDHFMEDVPTSYLYVFGFYWSATAMFSGASVTLPYNSVEAAISVVFVIFGILLASSLISTLAALLIDFQMNERESTDRMRTLRRFLKQHKISLTLSIAIQKQVIERMAVERRLSEQDVSVLNLISANLRLELRHALCDAALITHDILRALIDVDIIFAQDLVTSDAIEIRATSPGEEVFHARESLSSAIVVVSGNLRYSAWSESLNSSGVMVPKLKWMCECAIWAEWTSRGLLEATTPSEVVSLNAMELGKVGMKCAAMASLLRDLSVKFCMAIEKEQPSNFDDLEVGMSMDTVMYILAGDSRTTLSMPVLASLRTWPSILRPSSLRTIEDEVDAGLCLLRTDANGWAIKVTQVAILKLTREDGTTCVKLPMDSTRRVLNGKVALPSVPVLLGELPRDAIQRLIETELPELTGVLKVHNTEVHVSEKVPLTHKVRMKHIQNVCHASVEIPNLDDADRTFDGLANLMDADAVAALLEGSRKNARAPLPAHRTVSEASSASPTDVQVSFNRFGWISPGLLESLLSRRPNAADAMDRTSAAALVSSSYTLSAMGSFEVKSVRLDPESKPESAYVTENSRGDKDDSSRDTLVVETLETGTKYLQL